MPGQSLPWPRGSPPRFPGLKRPDYSQQHWSTGDLGKCGQCGTTDVCVHKNELTKKMHRMFGGGMKEARPEFMLESKMWLEELKKVQDKDGRLRLGQPLPPGIRRGWGSFPGHTVSMGSPGRHGDWRLVWVKKGEGGEQPGGQGAASPGSKHKLAARQRPSGGEGGARDPGLESDGNELVQRAIADARAVSERPTPDPLASVMARGHCLAARKMERDHAWGVERLDTGNLVSVINRTLRGEEREDAYQSLSRSHTQRSHSVPLTGPSVQHTPHPGRAFLARPQQGRDGGDGQHPRSKTSMTESSWADDESANSRVKMLSDIAPKIKFRQVYRGAGIREEAPKKPPTKTKQIDMLQPVICARDPYEAIEQYQKTQKIEEAKRKRAREGKRRRRKKA